MPFPFSLIAFAQTEISSSLASIIISATPLFVVVIAAVALSDERLTVQRLISVTIGLTGVVIMIGPSALRGIGSDVIAQLAMLGAALCYASSTVYARRFKEEGLTPSVLVTGQVTMSSLLLIPTALYFDQPLSIGIPGGDVVAAVLGVTLLSTVLAYILYFRILSASGATNVALVAFLIPVSAILLGVGILGESITAIQVLGMASIALGLAIMDGRLIQVHRLRRSGL
ncbi:MAG: DMT family transporter [Acidiferrobacterales bacterium]|nr:DMT family transporter [Acidiferrobacterales bacterium]